MGSGFGGGGGGGTCSLCKVCSNLCLFSGPIAASGRRSGIVETNCPVRWLVQVVRWSMLAPFHFGRSGLFWAPRFLSDVETLDTGTKKSCIFFWVLTFTLRVCTSCVRVTKVEDQHPQIHMFVAHIVRLFTYVQPTMAMLIIKADRQCAVVIQVLAISDRSIFTCIFLGDTHVSIPGRKPEHTCCQRIVRSGQSQHTCSLGQTMGASAAWG